MSQSVRSLLCHDLACSAIAGLFLAMYPMATMHGMRVYIKPGRRRGNASVRAESKCNACMSFFFL